MTALALVLMASTAMAQSAAKAAAPAAPAELSTVNLDVPPPAAPVPGANGPAIHNNTKNLTALEEKVTESTKNVVKQLSEVDNVNLDDLNTARQAVVKLEILIDIEKHLAELDKLHADRAGEKTLAGAIPATALMPTPGSLPMPHNNREATHANIGMPTNNSFGGMGNMGGGGIAGAHTEVTQITGADGHYSAIIQGKTVHVGDTLADGSTVVSIATKEVTVKKDGTIKQLKIKGVDEVYGHTL